MHDLVSLTSPKGQKIPLFPEDGFLTSLFPEQMALCDRCCSSGPGRHPPLLSFRNSGMRQYRDCQEAISSIMQPYWIAVKALAVWNLLNFDLVPSMDSLSDSATFVDMYLDFLSHKGARSEG